MSSAAIFVWPLRVKRKALKKHNSSLVLASHNAAKIALKINYL